MEKIKNPDRFFGELSAESEEVKKLLFPLHVLTPRDRAVFLEYHYWKTHMKVVAESHKISLGRAYEILYRAEEKVASARAQDAEEGSDHI